MNETNSSDSVSRSAVRFDLPPTIFFYKPPNIRNPTKWMIEASYRARFVRRILQTERLLKPILEKSLSTFQKREEQLRKKS